MSLINFITASLDLETGPSICMDSHDSSKYVSSCTFPQSYRSSSIFLQFTKFFLVLIITDLSRLSLSTTNILCLFLVLNFLLLVHISSLTVIQFFLFCCCYLMIYLFVLCSKLRLILRRLTAAVFP